MTRETLERLLTDRALGALDPDVAALLDAHLAVDADAAALAARTDATVALAQRALGAQPAARPPGFPRAELSRRAARARRWRVARGVVAAAAMVGLGVLAGRWTLVGSDAAPAVRSAAPQPVAHAVLEPLGTPADANTSVLRKSMMEWQRRANRAATPRWNWISPAKLPSVGGAS
jgi:anti-sigma factor RsiW